MAKTTKKTEPSAFPKATSQEIIDNVTRQLNYAKTFFDRPTRQATLLAIVNNVQTQLDAIDTEIAREHHNDND